jgi:phosphotriesterase-related protein
MKITTVCGDIAPEQLGFTSMHEHTMLDLSIAGTFMKNMFSDVTDDQLVFTPENYGFLKTGTYLLSKDLQVVDDFDYLVRELSYFKAIGGKSICDCSPIGVRININKIRELSEVTGLNIVCATGLYTETSRPSEFIGKDETYMYNVFKKEIEDGIDGTDIKPGFLKCALATYGAKGIADGEIAALHACVKLSIETGMSVHIHTDAMLDGDSIVNAIDEAVNLFGINPDRILVCHMDNRIAAGVLVGDYLEDPDTDRTLDLDLQKTLLDKGMTIGLDTWGMPVSNPNFFMPDDMERLKTLITLINLGYTRQISLGDDFASKIQGRSYGGFGYTRFAEFGLPMLEQLGYEDKIPVLTIENPAHILAF